MPNVFAPELIPQSYFYGLASGLCEYSHRIHAEGAGRRCEYICEGANTYFKNNSSEVFSCICASANTGPTCIHKKVNSSRLFSLMYWFCTWGICVYIYGCIYNQYSGKLRGNLKRVSISVQVWAHMSFRFLVAQHCEPPHSTTASSYTLSPNLFKVHRSPIALSISN